VTRLAHTAGPAPAAGLAFDARTRTQRGSMVVVVDAQEATMRPYAAATPYEPVTRRPNPHRSDSQRSSVEQFHVRGNTARADGSLDVGQ